MTTLREARTELEAFPPGKIHDDWIKTFEKKLNRYEQLLENIQEVQRTRLEIHLITQIALSLANTLDLDEILKLIISSVKQVVDFDAAGIFIVSEDGQLVEGEYITGYGNGDLGKIRQKLGQGLMGWAMEQMAPITVMDVARDNRYINARKETRSELVVPMFTGGKVIGCLNLESNKVGAFSERDTKHLTTFASHAAVAVERTRLHRELLEKHKIDEELVLARSMQIDLLPKRAPKLEKFDIAGVNVPSRAVGGDYFDYIPLSEKDLGIVVSDVAGKGIPAAFIMSSLRAALRIEALSRYALSSVLSKVNDFLHESTEPEIFVTAFYGVLDTQTGVLTYANAGHNPPLLIRADGRVEMLSEGGMLLGAFPDALYHEHRVSIKTNDTLVLYTDGATEAENQFEEQFDIDGIINTTKNSAGEGARAVIRELLKSIRLHTGTTNLQDDITLMVIQCR